MEIGYFYKKKIKSLNIEFFCTAKYFPLLHAKKHFLILYHSRQHLIIFLIKDTGSNSNSTSGMTIFVVNSLQDIQNLEICRR